jgi:thiamine kinase-like enzyme
MRHVMFAGFAPARGCTSAPVAACEQRLDYCHLHDTNLVLCCLVLCCADPHPGNLLKTKDGRLAYLDFGEWAAAARVFADVIHMFCSGCKW